ncbi:MAG TPA: outer membrane lipoprotein carrier protein LolA, partial [Bdellovibrionales bacterium]|nr:outer membrane lipoprotein carrier protein LolA [Bdellovibrionales bacterium]
KTVDAVLASYREAQGVSSPVIKTVKQEIMGTETTSDGKFFFSKGKLRLEFKEPEKSLLVFDGKYVWLETYLDEKTVQVAKMRSNDLKRSKSVLTAVFDKKNVLRDFKNVKTSEKDGRGTYAFEPKNKKTENEVMFLEVALKGKELEKLTYKDNLENQVSFEFKKITRGEVAPEKFSYKPPKKAEVTEY